MTIEVVAGEKNGDETSSVLLKPNAGGFGAGVKKIDPVASDYKSLKDNETISNYADHVTLVQEYVEADCIYRVWFLCGKVQCGIARRNVLGENEFTSACMSNTCTRQPKASSKATTIRAFKVPNDIKEELEERLLPLLTDAHSGSVEFLYNKTGERLYFDLNLLSTLPMMEQVEDVDDVWGRGYDSWNEMANAIVNMLL
jgi:hypothetical protein